MFFTVTKIIQALLLPPASLLILLTAGIAVIRRHRTAGRALVATGIALLYLLSLAPVADRLIRPLEAACPPFSGTPSKADAVVVLSGGARDLSWLPAPPAPSDASLERLAAGIQIAKQRLPLIITGGSGEITPGSVREADAMADTAVKLGFRRRDLIVESRSRNTWENAVEVGRLFKGRTIVLVTSAFHMKRSVEMFRKQGFTVIPAPTAYKSLSRPPSAVLLIPRSGSLDTSAVALSEYLSLAWYGFTGKL